MTQSVDDALAAFQPHLPLVVAYSGGVDSTALLLACQSRWPGQVRAVHVHHGLQVAGDDFEAHCRARCERWSIPLVVSRVDARAGAGESPEAVARERRYEALTHAALHAWPDGPARTVALGQHADDQAETVLLALTRGAGLPGLAAMPTVRERDGLRWSRPWLRVSRGDLEAWLRARDEDWLQDPMNEEERYTRVRLRRHVLPALETVTPAWRDTLARSAAHAAQAQELLDEVAAEDMVRVGRPPRIEPLRALSPARLVNVLRAWLAESGARASAAQLDELCRQIGACATRGHRLHLKVGSGHVLRQGAALVWRA